MWQQEGKLMLFFLKGSWGWKTCCTMLPFKPNTFFSTLNTEMSFLLSYFPGNHVIWSFHTPGFLFSFFFLVLPESFFELGPHFHEVVGYSTSPVAPLRSGEATQAVMLLLVLPSGSPLMSADCFGGILKSFFFHCCFCSVSTTAVQLYGKILQWNNRLQN